MGEYAKRLKDGEDVKIGTCECMYYCRYEQLHEIDYGYNTDNLLWRIPTPDEDGIDPGDFEFGGLYHDKRFVRYHVSLKESYDDFKELADNAGIVQLYSDKIGLLINVPCHHGIKLPDINGAKCFWNGKINPLHLAYIKNTDKELLVGVRCMACGKMWSIPLGEIMPSINSLWMKLRLLHQCTDYWHKHNIGEPCTYSVTVKNKGGRMMEIYNTSGDVFGWVVSANDNIIKQGTWEECRNEFIERLDDGRSCPDEYRNNFSYYDTIKEMKKRYLSHERYNQ